MDPLNGTWLMTFSLPHISHLDTVVLIMHYTLFRIYFLLHLLYFNVLTSSLIYFVLFYSLLCLQGATVTKQFPLGINEVFRLINYVLLL